VTVAVQFEPGVPVPFGADEHDVPVIVLRVPWLGPLPTLKVRLGLSMSAPLSVMGRAVSSFVETLWLAAVGASFTAVTVMDTDAKVESRAPSFTLNVKLSGPL